MALKEWMEVECSKIIDCNDKEWLVVMLMQFCFLPTEFQKQEGMKSHQKNMQLYDMPYEPEGRGSDVESDSEDVVSHCLRESKLPQDDDRPADEYDQPWEWNKVTIPALAGRILGSQPGNSLHTHSMCSCLQENSSISALLTRGWRGGSDF